jgi:tetratricopeptide (TPR) repeat protein
MLAGEPPFRGSTAFEVSSAILREARPPLPAGVPSGLQAIVERCLEKQPEERYQNAGEVRAALETLQAAAVPAAATPGRKRWLWLAAAAAVLALAGVWIWQQQPGQQQPRTAARTLSTGATPSAIREANEAFELAIVQLRQDIARAQELLQRALSQDPHFAAARQLLATTYIVQIIEGESNDASLLYKADEELRRAAQEDPSLLGVHADLAGVALMQGDKQRALAEVNRVLAQDPLSMGARTLRVGLHQMAEENAEAKEIALSILELDPLFPPARIILSEILLTEGDTAGALREARTLAEQQPNSATGVERLSSVYMSTDELNQARKLLEDKRAVLGNNYRWRLSWALLLALENKRDEALRAMDEETLKWADTTGSATLHAAEFYAVLGDTSKAIDWLDRAVRKGDERVEWFRENPRLASIRDDPRFQRIINSIEARKQPKEK